MEAVLKREVVTDKNINRALALFFAVIFLSLGAFVRVPLFFTPVPLTLQTFFVLLFAGLLGSRMSFLTQVSYLCLGAAGLPVFAQAASGLSYFLSPTAGYLLGFILASFLIGRFIKQAKESFLATVLLFGLADLVILFSGTVWLKLVLHTSLVNSFVMGFLPFISGDILKIIAAAALYLKLKPRVSQIL
jgi:biotin transport system substrate-specific component